MSAAVLTKNLPVPTTAGSLNAYIYAVNQVPVLTLDEEQAFAKLRDPIPGRVQQCVADCVSTARELSGYRISQIATANGEHPRDVLHHERQWLPFTYRFHKR